MVNEAAWFHFNVSMKMGKNNTWAILNYACYGVGSIQAPPLNAYVILHETDAAPFIRL